MASFNDLSNTIKRLFKDYTLKDIPVIQAFENNPYSMQVSLMGHFKRKCPLVLFLTRPVLNQQMGHFTVGFLESIDYQNIIHYFNSLGYPTEVDPTFADAQLPPNLKVINYTARKQYQARSSEICSLWCLHFIYCKRVGGLPKTNLSNWLNSDLGINLIPSNLSGGYRQENLYKYKLYDTPNLKQNDAIIQSLWNKYLNVQ